MALAPGTRLGPYEITAPLGAGGMGEVYKATDTRLDRTVAIKVLPEHVAADPELKQRFEREAKTLAALSHPHICPVFDVGSQEGIDFLVMEYLEGDTLAQRLTKGALPLDQALQVAIQIADALDKAHRRGIVHRDLKPGNIMLTKSGAKLLDFGLAKLRPVSVTGGMARSQAPTVSGPLTDAGSILGTFQYMAPEQLEGQETDARTDIFAFGAVVYESVTGKRAFEGKSQASLIAAILERNPAPMSSLQPVSPAALDRVVTKCLSKNPDSRWQTARDLQDELTWVAEGTTTEGHAAGAVTPGSVGSTESGLRQGALAWAVAGVCGLTLGGILATWAPWQEGPRPLPALVRFAIVPPVAQRLFQNPNDRQLAISPDGTRLVYVASGAEQRLGQPLTTQLMVHALDRLEAEPLRGTSEARGPFISYDGSWAGFFAGSELRKVSMSGGAPITLCQITGASRGASWGTDDTIVFATGDTATGLMSVAAGGGAPRVLTKPDAAQNEADHVFPSVLPSGRAVLFTITAPGGVDNAQVAVLDLETLQQKTLIHGGSNAEFVESGHLVYAAAGTLHSVRFDPVRLEVLSDPVPAVEEVARSSEGAAQYSVSRSGALVYVSRGGVGAVRSFMWVNRQGREEPVTAPPRAYFALRLSPDGTRAALDIRDQENDIWLWDFARQTLTRLTFDPALDIFPVWTPDGRRIVFRRAGDNALLWRNADGTGTDERLTAGGSIPIAMSFPPDGKNLVVMDQGDLALLPMDGKGQITPLMRTEFAEGLGEISPDGRWLAYQSNESGQDQIYVRPFPDVNSGRSQVSPGGGTKPVWARDGRELFYLDVNGALTAVSIQTTPGFDVGNPTKLFDTRYFSANAARSYDVSPDGQRFLMIKDLPAEDQSATATSAKIVVVLNWLEELKRLVPTN